MTSPIIVVKICYKLLYVIQVVKRFLISNFVASTNIKVFGHTYLFAMLLLIDLALFLHPECFCLALILLSPLSLNLIFHMFFTFVSQLYFC